MRELLRSLLLAAGMFAAAWCFWYTPAQLIAVRVVDFRQEYEAEFGEPDSPPIGITARAKAFLRRQTNPGSWEKYRQSNLAKRPVVVPPSFTPAFLTALASALHGEGPYAGRAVRNFVYFTAGEAPLDAIAPAIRRSLGDTGFLNAYGTAGNTDLEFYFHPEPHGSSAPTAVLFPLRANAPLYAALAILVYLALTLLPGAGVRRDPLPLAVLDLVAAVTAAFLFGLPLWIYPSTQAALDDLFGGTFFSWGAAALPLFCMLGLAASASYRIRFDQEALRIRHWLSARTIPFSQIALVRETVDDVPEPGLELQLTTGERLQVRYRDLRDALCLVHQLQRFGWLRTPPGASP